MAIGSVAPLPSSPVADGIDSSSPVADDPNTRREEKLEEGMELLRASKGTLRRIDMKAMTVCAELGEMKRRNGDIPPPPPIELVDYPDIFERAWGWDSILPADLVTPLALYKIYLRQYYIRNHQRQEANAAAGADDHGNDLAALAHSCITMENHLISMWDRRAKSFTIDGDETEVPLVSGNITKRACEMDQVQGSEFPAAAIALKCITKEAELMCQCLISGDSVVSFTVSNTVRRCALSFMTYKDDYVPAAAAMLGIMKEADLVIDLLKGNSRMRNNAEIFYTDCVRHRTMLIMVELCDEYSAGAEPTEGDITGDLSFNESENKLADENGNHEERGNVNENENSKKELARNDVDERNRTDENQNPNVKLGRNSLEEGKVKPDTKAGTEKQVDPVVSSNESSTSQEKKKLKDLLEHQSPLYVKAGGHKKWISGCFNLAKPKPGQNAKGTAS